MKLPLSFLLIFAAAASTSRADVAVDDEEDTSTGKLLAAFTTISKSIDMSVVNEDDGPDWASQLSCTADMGSQSPSLIDEATCSGTNDSDGNSCIWCDASQAIGSGLCVSTAQKTMLGTWWDQLCNVADSSNTPDDPPATTPNPTSPPTNNPTEPAPAPAPGPDDLPDQLKCSLDASSNMITDEATCVAQEDTTSSTAGEMCVWCEVPILGGSCITNEMKSQVSFLCQSDDMSNMKDGNLRGEAAVKGWKQLDPSCLSDGVKDKDSCASMTDSDGEACIWCSGSDVFGVCATSSQKDYLGTYLECEAESVGASSAVTAVE